MIYRLRNIVQHYAWGSHSAIPDLLGVAPDGTPQAELWIGANPVAASTVITDGASESLRTHIDTDPVAALGAQVARDFGELPFLVKFLAAAEPLSIQAHPSAEQARAGFEREDAEAIPRDAPNRTYRDPHAKPETLCALEPVTLLCGFREPDVTADLFDALGIGVLDDAVAMLRSDPPGAALRRVLDEFVGLDAATCETLVTALAAACAEDDPPDFAVERACLAELARRYPGDLGVLVAALLNLLHLEPGQAIFLPARTLHAYLNGVGIEIMGNSDNVIRAGLAPKYVDASELVDILEYRPSHGLILDPHAAASGELVYEAPVDVFRLSTITLGAGDRLDLEQWGPDLLLCMEGDCRVTGSAHDSVVLERGQSAFADAAENGFSLHAAATPTRLVRATVNRA